MKSLSLSLSNEAVKVKPGGAVSDSGHHLHDESPSRPKPTEMSGPMLLDVESNAFEGMEAQKLKSSAG